jgi:hypothetical protein
MHWESEAAGIQLIITDEYYSSQGKAYKMVTLLS